MASGELLFKLLILGDANVGKTSLLERFVEGRFDEVLTASFSVDCKEKPFVVEGKNTKLQIWDTVGQERFRTITNSFFRGAFGVVLVYDESDATTFEHLPDWLEQVDVNAPKSINKIVVGNKCDLDLKSKQVDAEVAKKWAAQHQMEFFEVSAKDGTNVDQAFTAISKQMVTRRTQISPSAAIPTSSFHVNTPKKSPKSNSGCCK